MCVCVCVCVFVFLYIYIYIYIGDVTGEATARTKMNLNVFVRRELGPMEATRQYHAQHPVLPREPAMRPGVAVRVAPGFEDFDGLQQFMGLVGYLRRRDKHGWYVYFPRFPDRGGKKVTRVRTT